MPNGENYLDLIYNSLNTAYKASGDFTATREDFIRGIESDTSYANDIFNALNDAYGSNGTVEKDQFTASKDDFFKAIYKEKAPKIINTEKKIEAAKKAPAPVQQTVFKLDAAPVSEYEKAQKEYDALVNQYGMTAQQAKGRKPLPIPTQTKGPSIPGIGVPTMTAGTKDLISGINTFIKQREQQLSIAEARAEKAKAELDKQAEILISNATRDEQSLNKFMKPNFDGERVPNDLVISSYVKIKLAEAGGEPEGLAHEYLKNKLTAAIGSYDTIKEAQKRTDAAFSKKHGGKTLQDIATDQAKKATADLFSVAKKENEAIVSTIDAARKKDIDQLIAPIRDKMSAANSEIDAYQKNIESQIALTTAAFEGRQMSADDANAAIKALQDDYEAKFNAYKQTFEQLNLQSLNLQGEVNSRYNRLYARRRQELEATYTKKAAELEKTFGKLDPKLVAEYKQLFAQNVEDVEKAKAASKNIYLRTKAGIMGSPALWAADFISGFGSGALKPIATALDWEWGQKWGDYISRSFTQSEDALIQEIGDLLDPVKFSKSTFGTIGGMVPTIVAGLGTAGLASGTSVIAQLAIQGGVGMAIETAQNAGAVKDQVFRETGSLQKANRAANITVQDNLKKFYLYFAEGVPFISKLSLGIKGAGVLPTLGRAGVKGAIVTVFEVPQEFNQGGSEKRAIETIRMNGEEVKLSNYTNVIENKPFKDSSEKRPMTPSERLYETALNVVAPTFFMGGAGEVATYSFNKISYGAGMISAIKNKMGDISPNFHNQFIYDLYLRRGENYTAGYITSLRRQGLITQEEFTEMANKFDGMKKVADVASRSKLTPGSSKVLMALQLDADSKKAVLDAATDETERGLAQVQYDKSKANLDSFIKGKNPDYLVVRLENNEQYVLTYDEAQEMLSDPDFVNKSKGAVRFHVAGSEILPNGQNVYDVLKQKYNVERPAAPGQMTTQMVFAESEVPYVNTMFADLESRMTNAEEIPGSDIDIVLDGLYEQLEIIYNNYFDTPAGQEAAKVVSDKIDQLTSYEFRTGEEVKSPAEGSTAQAARRAVEERRGIIDRTSGTSAAGPYKSVTVTTGFGERGAYAITFDEQDRVVLNPTSGAPITIGFRGQVNKAIQFVSANFGKNGMPTSLTFRIGIPNENGVMPEVTMSTSGMFTQEELLDILIDMRAAEVGEVTQEDFDNAYNSITRPDAIQEQAAGQVPVQPEARPGETVAERAARTGPEKTAQAGQAKVQAQEGAPQVTSQARGETLAGMTPENAVRSIARALQASGIKVFIIETQEEMDKISGLTGTDGLFTSTKGEIYFSLPQITGTFGKTIIFHEATHPVINIIRNTNPDLYKKVDDGLKQAMKSNAALRAAAQSIIASPNYATQEQRAANPDIFDKIKNGLPLNSSEIARMMEPGSAIEDEIIVETIARIASGDINPSSLSPSLIDSLKEMINKIAAIFNIPPIAKVSDRTTFINTARAISDALKTGKSIAGIVGEENVGRFGREGQQGRYLDANGNPITQNDIQFSIIDRFTDQRNGFIFEYIADHDDFLKLKAAGIITDDKTLDYFVDKYVFGHRPDAAFTGNIKKKDPLGKIIDLVEGKGGVFYPIRFIKELLVWASTENAATSMARQLNENAKKNGGSIFMALVSAPEDKLLSSTTSSNGLIDIIKAMSNDTDAFKIPVNAFKKALLRAAKSTAVNAQGKVVGLGLKNLTSANTIDEIESAVRTKLAADRSIFDDRKTFSLAMITEFTKEIKGTKSEQTVGKFLVQGVGVAGYKQQGKLISEGKEKYRLSPANMISAISQMMGEPMLRGESSNKIYAIIEITPHPDGVDVPSVEPFDPELDSERHESYPKAIKLTSDKMSVKVHILQDRELWTERLEDPDTGAVVSKDRELKLFPTSGVTTTSLKVLPKSTKASGVSRQLSAGIERVAPTEEEINKYLSEQEFFRSTSPFAWAVDPVSRETLEKSTIVENDGTYAVVTEDGDIKGVFNPNAAQKRDGIEPKKNTLNGLIPKAIAAGGIKLDNFDGRLTELYSKNGFRKTSSVPFNEEYAPEGWIKEQHGTPDVVAMVYDPENKLDIEFKKFEDYGDMISYRDSFVDQARAQASAGIVRGDVVMLGGNEVSIDALKVMYNSPIGSQNGAKYGDVLEYNGNNKQIIDVVNYINNKANPYVTEDDEFVSGQIGKLKGGYIESELMKAFDSMPFNKFMVLYRKHIDPNLKRESRRIPKGMKWEEVAFGAVTETKMTSKDSDAFIAFAKDAGITIPPFTQGPSPLFQRSAGITRGAINQITSAASGATALARRLRNGMSDIGLARFAPGVENKALRDMISQDDRRFYTPISWSKIKDKIDTMSEAELIDAMDVSDPQTIWDNIVSLGGPAAPLALQKYMQIQFAKRQSFIAAGNTVEAERIDQDIKEKYISLKEFGTILGQALGMYRVLKSMSSNTDFHVDAIEAFIDSTGGIITKDQRAMLRENVDAVLAARLQYESELQRINKLPAPTESDMAVLNMAKSISMNASTKLNLYIATLMQDEWASIYGTAVKGGLLSYGSALLSLMANTLVLPNRIAESALNNMTVSINGMIRRLKGGNPVSSGVKAVTSINARGLIKALENLLQEIKKFLSNPFKYVSEKITETRNAIANYKAGINNTGALANAADIVLYGSQEHNDRMFGIHSKMNPATSMMRVLSSNKKPMLDIKGMATDIEQSYKKSDFKSWLKNNYYGMTYDEFMKLNQADKESIKDQFFADKKKDQPISRSFLKDLAKATSGSVAELNFRMLALTDYVPKSIMESHLLERVGNNLGLEGVDLELFKHDPYAYVNNHADLLSPEVLNYVFENAAELTMAKETGAGRLSVATVNLIKNLPNLIRTKGFGKKDQNAVVDSISGAISAAVDTTMPYVRLPMNATSYILDFAFPLKSAAKSYWFFSLANEAKKRGKGGLADSYSISGYKYMSRSIIGSAYVVLATTIATVPGLVRIGGGKDEDEEERRMNKTLGTNVLNVSAFRRYINNLAGISNETTEYRDGDTEIDLKNLGVLGMMIYAYGSSYKSARSKFMDSKYSNEMLNMDISKNKKLKDYAWAGKEDLDIIDSFKMAVQSVKYMLDQAWFLSIANIADVVNAKDDDGYAVNKLMSTYIATAASAIPLFSAYAKKASDVVREMKGEPGIDTNMSQLDDFKLDFTESLLYNSLSNRNYLMDKIFDVDALDDKYVSFGMFGKPTSPVRGEQQELPAVIWSLTSPTKDVVANWTETERFFNQTYRQRDMIDLRGKYSLSLMEPKLNKKETIIVPGEAYNEAGVTGTFRVPAKDYNELTMMAGKVNERIINRLADRWMNSYVNGVKIVPEDLENPRTANRKEVSDVRKGMAVAISESHKIVNAFLKPWEFLKQDTGDNVKFLGLSTSEKIAKIQAMVDSYVLEFKEYDPATNQAVDSFVPLIDSEIQRELKDLADKSIEMYVRELEKSIKTEKTINELNKREEVEAEDLMRSINRK